MIKKYYKDYFLSNEFLGILGISFIARLRLGHLITIGCNAERQIDGLEKCVSFVNDFSRGISFILDIILLLSITFTITLVSKLLIKAIENVPMLFKATKIFTILMVIFKWWKYTKTFNSTDIHIFNVGFMFQVKQEAYSYYLGIVSILIVYMLHLIHKKEKHKSTRKKNQSKYLANFIIAIILLLSMWIFTF